jgi:hypothetical protein
VARYASANRSSLTVRGIAIRLTAFAIMMLSAFVLVEIGSSLFLIYGYRWTGALREGALLSSAVLVQKAWSRYNLGREPGRYEFAIESSPSPFTKPDPYFGYSASAGEYTHIYKRRLRGDSHWESLRTKVTITDDGARSTGRPSSGGDRTVYILGDSSVFGVGVSDEQTFASYFQAARRHDNVKLFALGGYAMAHAYLRFQRIKNQIGANDVIVLGYADYYDERNVAAPSRLRNIRIFRRDRTARLGQIPRVELNPDGSFRIELIEQDCRKVPAYCRSSDPSPSYMTSVSASLINEIARGTEADVYVLHFSGSKENPLFARLDQRIHVISALPTDFDYFVDDDVAGFDPHPGPYWHYAISRKLAEHIR